MYSLAKNSFLIAVPLLMAIFSYPVFSPACQNPYPIMMNWFQTIGGTVYVGLLFFETCVLPKGTLQSTAVKNRYQRVFTIAFVLFFASVLFYLPVQLLASDSISYSSKWLHSIVGQVWLIQIFILLFICLLPFWQKNIVLIRWTSFVLGIFTLASSAIVYDSLSPMNRYAVIATEFFHLLSISIFAGGLTAFFILLPVRKSKEGRLFFDAVVFLFLPWGAAALAVLGAASYSAYLLDPLLGVVMAGKGFLSFLLLLILFLHFIKGYLKYKKSSAKL